MRHFAIEIASMLLPIKALPLPEKAHGFRHFDDGRYFSFYMKQSDSTSPPRRTRQRTPHGRFRRRQRYEAEDVI